MLLYHTVLLPLANNCYEPYQRKKRGIEIVAMLHMIASLCSLHSGGNIDDFNSDERFRAILNHVVITWKDQKQQQKT